jgi:hypothetical protein
MEVLFTSYEKHMYCLQDVAQLVRTTPNEAEERRLLVRISLSPFVRTCKKKKKENHMYFM